MRQASTSRIQKILSLDKSSYLKLPNYLLAVRKSDHDVG